MGRQRPSLATGRLPITGGVPVRRVDLDGYTMTKSALRFPIDRPLPKTLIRKLIATRLES